jgi:hypothetical protein
VARLYFDANGTTVRRTERGYKVVITAESTTQLTAFALNPTLLKSFAAQVNRAVREVEDVCEEREQRGHGQERR